MEMKRSLCILKKEIAVDDFSFQNKTNEQKDKSS